MNHDATHCSDYKATCPTSCYRAQLTKELLDFERWPHPVSWAKFRNTVECPFYETRSHRYYRRHREEILAKAKIADAKRKAAGEAYRRLHYKESLDE